MTTSLQPPADAVLPDEAALREIIALPSHRVVLKKTDRIDDKARDFLGRSPFLALATCSAGGVVDIAPRGGAPGFIRVLDETTLLIRDRPEHRLDGDDTTVAGVLVLIPGVNETLRLNGRAEAVNGPEPAIRLTIDEMFYHCPKAFIRSHLWDPTPHPDEGGAADPADGETVSRPALDGRCRALIGRSPFLFLGTSRPEGGADVSPRGDPAGFVRVLDDRTLLLPDRPGNRLADSFRNMLANPYAALLFLVPGEATALRVRARARLVTDPDLLGSLAVEGRTPKVAVWLDVVDALLSRPALLQEARLWDAEARAARASLPTLGELMVSQLACAGRADGLTPESVDTSVERDARENLY